MKVIRFRLIWTGQDQSYHLVEKFNYVQVSGGLYARHLLNPEVRTWCDQKHILEKKDDYTEYDKKLHKKHLCELCVKMITLEIRKRRKTRYEIAKPPV